MKLSEVRIKNFRSFDDETINFDDYTCFVGPNGSGKSTILQALNVFFRNSTGSFVNLHMFGDEDFHHKIDFHHDLVHKVLYDFLQKYAMHSPYLLL